MPVPEADIEAAVEQPSAVTTASAPATPERPRNEGTSATPAGSQHKLLSSSGNRSSFVFAFASPASFLPRRPASVRRARFLFGQQRGTSVLFPTYADLHTRPFLRQVRSKEWLAFTAFFALLALRFNFYIGTADALLTALGQSSSRHDYTSILGIMMPVGFFVQFIVGAVLDRMGLRATTLCLWVLAVLLSALTMIPVLSSQIATFLVFICFRGFLFSTLSAYMSRLFGFAHLGKVIGSHRTSFDELRTRLTLHLLQV
jgi:hypothetical protein